MKQTKLEQTIANTSFTIMLIYFIGSLLFATIYSTNFLRESFQSFITLFTVVSFNVYLDKKKFAMNAFDRIFETLSVTATYCIVVYCHEASIATTTMIILFFVSIFLNIFTKKLNLDQ